MHKEYNEITFQILSILFVFLALGIFIVILLFLYQNRQQKYLKEKLLLQTQFQQALLQTQIEIQSQTLQTISQEIHDNVGQVLSLARLNLATIEVPDNTSNQTKINDTKQLVSKAINDLRDLSRSLYGNKIAELGIADAIDNELKILQNSGQFHTSFNTMGEPYKLQPQKEMVIYRMLQESLNNAIKHSKAQNIRVVLNYDPGLFRLTLTDDGIGFENDDLPEEPLGMGLKSMQNRASLIGAEFNVRSSKNIGTSVNIKLPI